MSTADELQRNRDIHGTRDVPRDLPPIDERAKSDDPDQLPSPDEELPDIIIYSHSGLFYWWPVWVYGFVCAALTYAMGRPFINDEGEQLLVYPGAGLGLSFLAVMLATLIITSARLRGIYSIVALISGLLVFVTLAWLGLLDDVANLVPQISVHMNAGFFVATSTALLVIWASAFFFFDRLRYWRVRPGQLTEEGMIGDSADSYDTRGLLFEKHGEDYLRHKILGLGAGDLRLQTAGAKQATIEISDVLFVDKTVERVQRLIAIEPDSLR